MGTKRENLMNRNVREFLSEGMYERSTTLTAIETKQDAVGTLNPDDDRSSVSHSVPVLDDNGDVIMVVTNIAVNGSKSLKGRDRSQNVFAVSWTICVIRRKNHL